MISLFCRKVSYFFLSATVIIPMVSSLTFQCLCKSRPSWARLPIFLWNGTRYQGLFHKISWYLPQNLQTFFPSDNSDYIHWLNSTASKDCKQHICRHKASFSSSGHMDGSCGIKIQQLVQKGRKPDLLGRISYRLNQLLKYNFTSALKRQQLRKQPCNTGCQDIQLCSFFSEVWQLHHWLFVI